MGTATCGNPLPEIARRPILRGRLGTAVNPLLKRVTVDPHVCGGKPCITGTRIWVSLILDFLTEGRSEAELRAEYPQLVHEDVLAAFAYGAVSARCCVLPLPVDPGLSLRAEAVLRERARRADRRRFDEVMSRAGGTLLREDGEKS